MQDVASLPASGAPAAVRSRLVRCGRMTHDENPLADHTLTDEDVPDVLRMAAGIAANAAVLAPELRQALGQLLLHAAAVLKTTGDVDPLVLDVAKVIIVLQDVPWRFNGRVVRHVSRAIESDGLEMDERGRTVLRPPTDDEEQ